MELKKLLLLIIYCLIGNYMYCINIQIDSLENKLQYTKNQYIELKIYEKLADYCLNSDIQKAKKYAQLACSLAIKLKNDSSLSHSCVCLGNVYYHLDDFDNCLNNYFKALQIADSLNLNALKSAIINNIGGVYFQLKNFPKTLEYCQKALKLKEADKDSVNIANFMSNIGSIYFVQNDLDKAYDYYNQALSIFKKTNNNNGIADVSNNIGEYFLKKKEYPKALNFFQTALQIYLYNHDYKGQARIYHNLGKLLVEEHNYKAAEPNILKSLSISDSINSKEIQIDNIKLLTELYINLSQNDKAIENLNKLIDRKDVMFSSEIASKIARLQSNFEINKKEQENLLLQQQVEINAVEIKSQKQKKNTFVIISIVFLLSTVLFLYSYRIIKFKNNELLSKSLELETANRNLQELNATKDKLSSVIAHEIKNPFAYVLGFAELILLNIETITKEKLKQYVELILQSANSGFELLTNLMDWSVTQTGRLQVFPQNIDANIVIKSNIKLLSRNANLKNITIDTNLNEELMVYSDQKLFDTVLRNLMHNAIKFTPIGGKISILVNKIDQYVQISVIDNGLGIPKENLDSLFSIGLNKTTIGTNKEKGSGLGLIICKEFIERNNGELFIESHEGVGSMFTFTIPLAKN